jgi:hypothetical protein
MKQHTFIKVLEKCSLSVKNADITIHAVLGNVDINVFKQILPADNTCLSLKNSDKVLT